MLLLRSWDELAAEAQIFRVFSFETNVWVQLGGMARQHDRSQQTKVHYDLNLFLQ